MVLVKWSPNRYTSFRKERRERHGSSERVRQVEFEGLNSAEAAAESKEHPEELQTGSFKSLVEYKSAYNSRSEVRLGNGLLERSR